MRCPEYIRVEQYLAGELPELDISLVEAHLAVCDCCRATVEECRMIDVLVAQTCSQIRIRDQWQESVVAKMESEFRALTRIRRRRRIVCVGLVAAATAATVLVATSMWKNSARVTPNVKADSRADDSIATVDAIETSSSPVESSRFAIPLVKAADGFLAARAPQSDDSFQLYWVLPIQSKSEKRVER